MPTQKEVQLAQTEAAILRTNLDLKRNLQRKENFADEIAQSKAQAAVQLLGLMHEHSAIETNIEKQRAALDEAAKLVSSLNEQIEAEKTAT